MIKFLDEALDHQNVEIEGKLGALVVPSGYSATGRDERLQLDGAVVHNLVALTPSTTPSRFRFRSGLPAEMFMRLQDLLTRRQQASEHKYRGKLRRGKSPLAIRRTESHTVDRFYSLGNGHEVRVTSPYGKLDEVIECMTKQVVSHVEFLSPGGGKCPDFRLSAKTEQPLPTPADLSSPTRTREKKRVSFSYYYWSFDVTEVREVRSRQPSYEVEVEISDIPWLRAERDKYRQGKQNGFQFVAFSLIDHLKTLCTYADDRNPMPPVCVHADFDPGVAKRPHPSPDRGRPSLASPSSGSSSSAAAAAQAAQMEEQPSQPDTKKRRVEEKPADNSG